MTATPLSNPRGDRTIVFVIRLALDEAANGTTINLALALGAAPPNDAIPALARLHTNEPTDQDGNAPAIRDTTPMRTALDAACAPPMRLSAREVEVLRLLAAGQTNPEIAEQLVLSPGTVARHTANIYTKIGARGRAEAAAFATHHGLVEL